MMTRTDRRGNPILDGVETAVAAARVAVSSALEAAFRCVSSTDAPIAVIQHSWAALFRLTRADLCRVAARAERTPLPDGAPNSPSSPSEKHGWRVFGGMMGPVQ